jgi:hypothetical protein
MAEWTGVNRTLNSLEPEAPPPVDAASDDTPIPPEAPGATVSPQRPGMTPDAPELPERPRGSMPPLESNRRPLTEYQTAQQRLRLFIPAPGTELESTDWEQGPISNEERRKVDPALLTPIRPLSGYGLGIGHALAPTSPPPDEAIAATASAVTKEAVGMSTPPASSDAATAPPTTAAAGDLPAGALRGDGTLICPPDFPVKGNAQSMIYHMPQSSVYDRTIPEFCFATAEAAEAAGFRASRSH